MQDFRKLLINKLKSKKKNGTAFLNRTLPLLLHFL